MKSANASSLSDAALIAEIKRLAQSEREVTVALIVHLAELEASSGTSPAAAATPPQPTG